jgi:hypothetical protein
MMPAQAEQVMVPTSLILTRQIIFRWWCANALRGSTTIRRKATGTGSPVVCKPVQARLSPPIPRMKFAIRSMAPPAKMQAAATNHGKTGGQRAINTPTEMNKIPGISIKSLAVGRSIIPMQVSAIGHIGIEVGCAIFTFSSLDSQSKALRHSLPRPLEPTCRGGRP